MLLSVVSQFDVVWVLDWIICNSFVISKRRKHSSVICIKTKNGKNVCVIVPFVPFWTEE